MCDAMRATENRDEWREVVAKLTAVPQADYRIGEVMINTKHG